MALSSNCLNNIDNLNSFTSLERLFVRDNQIDKLNLSNVTQLNICVVDNNPLCKISLQNMPNLKEIGLSKTKIQSQDDIDLPPTVVRIYMNNNLLKQVAYRDMPNLTAITQ